MTSGPRMTMDEYAEQCRSGCRRTAQGVDVPCGTVTTENAEAVYRFCGPHWGQVLDSLEEGGVHAD